MVTEAARKAKVVTQLGNQGHSDERIRQLVEWVRDGAIGQVKEVHAGTDAFKEVYCQIGKLPKMAEKHDVPKELSWDLWLGPVAERAYNPMYLPFNWPGGPPSEPGPSATGSATWWTRRSRRWTWAAPKTIQAEVDGYDPKKDAECYPAGVKVTYEFAAKDKRAGDALLVRRQQADSAPRVPREGPQGPGHRGDPHRREGRHPARLPRGRRARIIPEQRMKDYKQPAPSIPRVKEHHQEWLVAIREKHRPTPTSTTAAR